LRNKIVSKESTFADPGGRAIQGVDFLVLDCWDRGHGFSIIDFVVC
jgi:hypothetical protein